MRDERELPEIHDVRVPDEWELHELAPDDPRDELVRQGAQRGTWKAAA